VRALAPALLLAACVAVPAHAGNLYVWVDAEGHTHVTDDPKAVPPQAAAHAGAEAGLGGLWGGVLTGPEPPPTAAGSSRPEDRAASLVRSALDDLRRGETSRAAATLEGVIRLDPNDADAHWYLALLDRQRGRFESSERHLEIFLAHAGDGRDSWRASAERRLAALADERRLAEQQASSGPLRLIAAESPHFRIYYDEQLGAASPDYARTVVRFLEEAHDFVDPRFGGEPREPTGVVFYGKAAYLAAYQHRFSFPTIGFYDGRIHVASAAHPAGELRALLFHEYTHAVFSERTGGDRPFWLNEGLAVMSERAANGQEPVSHSERASLERHVAAGEWIPLRRLGPGFGGLDEPAARLAYLESTAAAAWLTERAGPKGLGPLLDRIGAGEDLDAALRRTVRLDTDGVDEAVRRSIAVEFPGEPASAAGGGT